MLIIKYKKKKKPNSQLLPHAILNKTLISQ